MLALEICNILQIDSNEIILKPRKNNTLSKSFTIKEFIEQILLTNTLEEVAINLGCTRRVLERAIKKIYTLPLQGGRETFKYTLLALIQHKYCNICSTIKSFTEFSVDNCTKADIKLNSRCKSCRSVVYKQWYENHKDEHNQNCAKRKRNLDRALTKEEIEFIFKRDNNQCKYCDLSNIDHEINFGTRLHIDHIVPISKGGLTTIENSQLLCLPCNSSKNNN